MIPIYICDDEPAILQALQQMLERIVVIEGHDMEVAGIYTAPEGLLAAIKADGRRGIYFLDVDLKDDVFDGFSLAAEIRKSDPRGFLIFVTAHGDLALETFHYRLEAMDYIEKNKPDKLAGRLSACLKEAKTRLLAERHEAKKVYSVQVYEQVRHIPVDEILYIETSPKQHKLVLHAVGAIIEYTGKIGEAEAALGDGFWRLHRSYLVSREHVRRVLPKDALVELDNGETCPLSRKAKRAFKAV